METENSIKYISLCGMLGYGYNIENFRRKIDSEKIDFIGVDAGSTDPGPYYLGSGKGFVKDLQTVRDLTPALIAAVEKKIPLIIGSAGGSGAKPHLDNTLTLIKEIAAKNSLSMKIAVIYSDIKKELIHSALQNNKIRSCENVHELTGDLIEKSVHVVAQMGTAPIIKALRDGADIVLAGRSCDTAIFASYPIMKGFDPGLALHAAKIAECGALCAVPAGANDSLFVELREGSFIVEPLSAERTCTPESVSAHSLYEQPHPHCFYEPEGKIDMTSSRFTKCGSRAVEVSGTVLEKATEETVKLEGSALDGYRAITLAGTCDPAVIENIDIIQEKIKNKIAETLNRIISENDYSLRFLRYGLDAVTFGKKTKYLPSEIGILLEAIAPSQEHADLIISLARSTALHQGFNGRKTTAGNLAFPFSPSDLQGGPVYEFSIYHLMQLENNNNLFPIKYEMI